MAEARYTPDELYQHIQRGSEAAFKQLFHELAKPLVYFGVKLTGSKEQAEDAVSEAFQTLYQKRASVTSYAGTRSLLYTIVHRRCVDHLKHQRVIHEAEPHLKVPDEHIHDVDAHIMQAETMLAIYKAIEALPAHHREIIHQSFIAELSTREIAGREGRTEAHVRTAKARAIAALRLILKERGLMEVAMLVWMLWQKK